MPRLSLLPFAFCLLPSLAFAQPRPVTPKDAKEEPAANADSKFSLTIYSTADPATFDPQQFLAQREFNRNEKVAGYGVVREIRKVPLEAGESQVRFADVAAGIDPTTVSFKSLTAPDSTSVLEQNFEFDVVSPDKLLEKYLGKNVIINRKQELLPGERMRTPDTIEAKLLSFTRDQLVVETNNKQLPVQMIPRNQDITEIKLFDLKTGLITKPTLVWRLNAQQAGDHDVLVSYQTDNITWRADYSVVVNAKETAADLLAWVTVVNQSGASYPNSRLKLVAGDVQRLKPGHRGGWVGNNSSGLFGGDGGDDTGFKEKSLFEYHLYTLGRRTSIADNSTKQIELFPSKANLPATKSYVYHGFQPDHQQYRQGTLLDDRDLRGRANKKVDVYLQLKNSEKAGLGIPLPAGRVRVYKRDDAAAGDDDPAGNLEFIGEDKVDHTPREEHVLVRLGSAFDIVGERKQTNFTEEGRVISESFEIKLRNRKREAVTVLVKENAYRWSQWEVTAASEKHVKHDARTIHFNVELKPDEERAVTYTVKYAW